MTENAKMARVKISMVSGKEHEFEMPREKATDLLSVVTHFAGQKGKQWIDMFDYTETLSGQRQINLLRIELIEFDLI